MGLMLAFKTFVKALREPSAAKRFLEGEEVAPARESSDLSHLRLLSLLQQSARLVDFFKEDLSGCSDAQVGAAARKVHEDCRKKLDEWVAIRPIFEEQEGSSVVVGPGYDPRSIKITGKVKGVPPFRGVLVHKGWKAQKRSLPKQVGEQDAQILCPGEVEIQ